MPRGLAAKRMVVSNAAMQISFYKMSTGLLGLFLAAWGTAALIDYVLPGWLWPVFLVLAVIFLGLYAKAVHDGRLQ
jgi:hypothetical protein